MARREGIADDRLQRRRLRLNDLLILRRHKFILLVRWQRAPHGRTRTMARAIATPTEMIEAGTWRPDRIGEIRGVDRRRKGGVLRPEECGTVLRAGIASRSETRNPWAAMHSVAL